MTTLVSLCQVEGWEFLSSIPLLGADSHMDEAKKSTRVRTHPPQQSRDFCRSTVVRDSQLLLCRPRGTGQLWRSGAHMFIRVLTHIHVHVTGTRTHKITDRSYPYPGSPAPQHPSTPAFPALGMLNGSRRSQWPVSGPSERGTAGQDQDFPPPNI